MPIASPPPDLSDLSAPPADSDPWTGQFKVSAEAGMELGDLLAEHGAIGDAAMKRLTEIHEALHDTEDMDADHLDRDNEDELSDEASRIVMHLLPSVWRMVVWQGHNQQDDLHDAREAGFVTGFMAVVAATVLVGPASSRWAPPDGEKVN